MTGIKPGELLADDGGGGDDRLLTAYEVAVLFRVDPKTVARWAAAEWIPSIRTPGGHRRFKESVVQAILRDPDAWRRNRSRNAKG